MRGRFTPDTTQEEWCERRVLARIHRYTVNRLRQEIQPVELRDFIRFLFHWQRVAPEARVEGPDAVSGVISQLEAFEAPAAADNMPGVDQVLSGVARNPMMLRALVSTGIDFNRALRSLRGCRGFLLGGEGLVTADL